MEKAGYSYRKHHSNYAGVEQRWLVVHSVQAQERAVHTIESRTKKEFERLQKEVKKLQKRLFESEDKAQKSVEKIQKKTKLHTVSITKVKRVVKYKTRGRPSKKKENEKKIRYLVHCAITENQKNIDLEIIKNAIFIIATNEMSEEKLSDQEVFDAYKDQQKIERGFRFLKDPLFFASSLFLKKPKRIVALTMIMCLSLLIYSVCERKLRMLLKEHEETIRDQLKKPTQRPTLRWIFQLLEDVHLVKIEENKQVRYEVTNLGPDAIKVLRTLGKNYVEPYLLE